MVPFPTLAFTDNANSGCSSSPASQSAGGSIPWVPFLKLSPLLLFEMVQFHYAAKLSYKMYDAVKTMARYFSALLLEAYNKLGG